MVESYSLREVAELLGVDYATLERRVREGAFPGRFVVDGPSGPEMRVPVADVERLTAVGRPAPAASSWRAARRPVESLVPYPASEVDAISSVPAQRAVSGLSRGDLESLRDAFVSAIRSEREWMIESMQEALAERDRTIYELRQEMGSMRRAVEAATSALDRVEGRLRAMWRGGDEPGWAEVLGAVSAERVDVDALLREVGELEAMLTDPS